MDPEKLKQIMSIMSKYDSSQEVVDYYQLFGVNKNNSVFEIEKELKGQKLQILFHPDQLAFIPSEYSDKYLQMVEVVKDCMNVFSSDTNKNRYDEKLNQHKIQSSNFGNSYNYQERNSYYQNDNKSVDLSEVIRQSVVANIQKHGFEFARTAILEAISKNYFGGFTRSVRKQMEDIGKLKIFEIISASSITDGDVNIEQVVMNYLTDLIYTERDFKDQVTSIDQAARTTFLKYDSNGVINQTLNALNRFSDLGDASGFTNENGCRTNLKSNVDYKNTQFLVQCILNKKRHDNPSCRYENIKDLNDQSLNFLYVSTISNELNKTKYESDRNYK